MRVPTQVTCFGAREAGLKPGREPRVCSSVGQSAPLIRVRPEVRIFPDPPLSRVALVEGAIAQLGERLLCKQEVIGSIPIGSTTLASQMSRDTTHAPHRAIRCMRGLTLRSPLRASSLTIRIWVMTPRIKLFQLVIRKRVAFAREIPADNLSYSTT